MNAAIREPMAVIRVDGNWNIISESLYRKKQKYNKLEKSFDNVLKSNDYNSQYTIIEKLNWLAHDIAKKTKDKSIEKLTYKMKEDFARKELERRWPSIAKRDNKVNMYYLTRPDGTKSIHVWDSVWKYAKKAKKRGK